VLSRQFALGSLDPDASPVVCQSLDRTESGFPRRVFLDGVFSATASSDVGLAVDAVVSFDGVNGWLATQPARSRANAGATALAGEFDLAPGAARGSAGSWWLACAATFSDSSATCACDRQRNTRASLIVAAACPVRWATVASGHR
jgi:hypothetical protein